MRHRRIIARDAAAADLPEDRRSPHLLPSTWPTPAPTPAVISELADDADIRTTTIYTPQPRAARARRR
jgi:hypothetical protein